MEKEKKPKKKLKESIVGIVENLKTALEKETSYLVKIKDSVSILAGKLKQYEELPVKVEFIDIDKLTPSIRKFLKTKAYREHLVRHPQTKEVAYSYFKDTDLIFRFEDKKIKIYQPTLNVISDALEVLKMQSFYEIYMNCFGDNDLCRSVFKCAMEAGIDHLSINYPEANISQGSQETAPLLYRRKSLDFFPISKLSKNTLQKTTFTVVDIASDGIVFKKVDAVDSKKYLLVKEKIAKGNKFERGQVLKLIQSDKGVYEPEKAVQKTEQKSSRKKTKNWVM